MFFYCVTSWLINSFLISAFSDSEYSTETFLCFPFWWVCVCVEGDSSIHSGIDPVFNIRNKQSSQILKRAYIISLFFISGTTCMASTTTRSGWQEFISREHWLFPFELHEIISIYLPLHESNHRFGWRSFVVMM